MPRRKADPVTDYAEKVVRGKYQAGRMVRWACERHLSDLRRDDVEWHPYTIDLLLEFFGYLRHYKGEHAGRSIDLEPWQIFNLGSVFGWYYPDGRRRYMEAYTQIARGNGKTTVAAGVALFGMTLDAESGPECYTVATKEDQAKICFRDCKIMVKHCPELNQILASRQKEIRNEMNDGILRPLGSDSDSLDGLNPHIVVADELHEWRTGDLYRVIRDGAVKRKRALIYSITTAGFNTLCFCKQVRDAGERILDPELEDFRNDRFFYFICEPDEPKQWDDEKQWFFANPNLGVSIALTDLREANEHKDTPPNTRENFLVKRLNVWGGGDRESWFPLAVWRELERKIDRDALKGRKCIGALDLADVHDLSAFVLYFPPDEPGGVGVLLSWFWCPEDDLKKKEETDRAPYVEWSRQGLIRPTPGNVTDRRWIEADLVKIADEWNPECIAYDPHAATDLVIRLQENHGLEMVQFRQGGRTMDPAVKELKRLVLGREVVHDGNPILDWNFDNLVIHIGPTGWVLFDKGKSTDRIDGAVAAAMAVGAALSRQEEGVEFAIDFV